MQDAAAYIKNAVWKYKSLPLLGLDMEDEKDELTPIIQSMQHMHWTVQKTERRKITSCV